LDDVHYFHWIVQKSRLLTQNNQEIAQESPDPFPREGVGSGNETNN